MQQAITGDLGASDQSLPPAQSKTAPYPWILHPVIDILFCCGGLLWLLLIPLFAGLKVDANLALFGFIMLNVLFSDTHQPATLFRVYASARTRAKVGIPITVAAVIVIALGAAALFSVPMAIIGLRVTFTWAVQHVMAQVYGVALIYCYKRQYIMTNGEKRTLFVLCNTAIAYAIIRMWTIPMPPGHLYNLDIPSLAPLPYWLLFAARLALQCAVVAFVFMVVRKWIKERKLFPLPALFTVVTALAATTVLPSFIHNGTMLVIAGAFIQNCFHSCQYNVVTTAYFLKEQGLPEGVPFSKIATQLFTRKALNYYGFLVVLGLTLNVGVAVALTLVGFQTAAAVVYCTSMHHYFSDALIWRMKDPAVRKLLVA